MMASRKFKAITQAHLFILALSFVGFASAQPNVAIQFANETIAVDEEVRGGRIDLPLLASGLTNITQPITVRFVVNQDGRETAEENRDFTIPNKEVIVSQGNETFVLPVNILDDKVVEGTEFFTVKIVIVSTGNDSAVVGPRSKVTVNIKDKLDKVTIRFPSGDVNQSLAREDMGHKQICMHIESGSSAIPLTVILNSKDGTAKANVDYGNITDRVITFNAGQTKACTDVTIKDNDAVDVEKTFYLVMTTTLHSVVVDPTPFRMTISNDDTATIGLNDTFLPVSENVGKVAVCMYTTASRIPVSVRLNTVNGTAKANVDYGIITDRAITFPPSQSQACTNVTITDNDIVDYKKVFYIKMTTTDPNVRIQDGRNNLTVTILNDDQAVIGFKQTFLSSSENAGHVPVCVDMKGRIAGSTIANITSDSNVIKSPPSVTFAANQNETCFDLIIQDNFKLEYNKTAHLTLKDHPLVSINKTKNLLTVLIVDDDYVTIQFANDTITVEEDIGGGKVDLALVMDGVTEIPINITLKANPDGTDTADEHLDYDLKTPHSTFLRGGRQRITLPVYLKDDSVVEKMESFTVAFSDSGPRVRHGNKSKALVKITDSSDKANIGFADVRLEATERDGKIAICMNKSENAVVPLNITLNTVDGTAKANVDYGIITDRVITFAASQSQACTDVTIKNNDIVEPKKVFYIKMTTTDPSVIVQDSRNNLTFTILNDDKVTIGLDATSLEKSENIGNVPVCMTKTGTTAIPLTVTLNTVDGTTTANVDYENIKDRVITFAASQSQACTDVTIKNNDVVESKKVFYIMMTTTDPSVIVQGSRNNLTFTLLNDDKVTIGFDATTLDKFENVGSVPVCMNKTGSARIPLTVTLNTVDGTANASADYGIITDRVITFPPSQSQACTDVTITDNDIVDYKKVFYIKMTTTDPSVIVQDNRKNLTFTILNDDKAIIGFIDPTFSVKENIPDMRVCMTKTGSTAIPLTVTLNTKDSTAKGNREYEIITDRNITFAAPDSTKCTYVTIKDNDIIHYNREFFIKMTTTDPFVTVRDIRKELLVIIRNDDKAIIGFDGTAIAVPEHSGHVSVCMNRTGPSSERSVYVTLNTESGRAKGNVDYGILTDSDIWFAPSQWRRCTDVTIMDNDITEYEKQFYIKMTRGRMNHYVTVRDSLNKLTVKILNDDRAIIGFTKTFLPVSESIGSVPVCVSMQGRIIGSVNVSFSSDSNVIKSPPSVTFAANQKETCFDLIIPDNTKLEYNKKARLTLSEDHPLVSTNQTHQLTVLIIDDDQVTIRFDNNTITVEEDMKGGKIDLHMVMEGVTEIPIHVKLVTNKYGADTAKDGRDFNMTSKDVTFTRGKQRIITPIYILDDADAEGMEFFTVNLEIATKTRAFKGKNHTEVLVQIKDSSDLAMASALKAKAERERLFAIGLSSSIGIIFIFIVAIALVVYLISRRKKRTDDSVESKTDADPN